MVPVPIRYTLGLLLITTVLLVAAPALVVAQSFENLIDPLVSLSLNPTLPKPNQTVTITAKSFSIDLNRATISWYLNGTLVRSGAGEITFTTTTGGAGSRTTVEMVAESGSGSVRETITIAPADVEILWEADTYTPPFYKGRALPTPGSTIRAVAVPYLANASGALISPQNLIFRWKVDGRVQGSQSGRGKSSITLESPLPFDSYILSVEVESVDGTGRSEAQVVIQSIDPLVTLYPVLPLTGTAYHDALAAVETRSETSLTIEAVPYFVRSRNPARDFSYTWNVTGVESSSDTSSRSRITLQPQTEVTARVSLVLAHIEHLFQTARDSWRITFSDTENSSSPFARPFE